MTRPRAHPGRSSRTTVLAGSSGWGPTIAIEPDGDGSLLHDALHVTIKVPLIGRKIESLVVSELKKGFDKYVSVVRDHAER